MCVSESQVCVRVWMCMEMEISPYTTSIIVVQYIKRYMATDAQIRSCTYTYPSSASQGYINSTTG